MLNFSVSRSQVAAPIRAIGSIIRANSFRLSVVCGRGPGRRRLSTIFRPEFEGACRIASTFDRKFSPSTAQVVFSVLTGRFVTAINCLRNDMRQHDRLYGKEEVMSNHSVSISRAVGSNRAADRRRGVLARIMGGGGGTSRRRASFHGQRGPRATVRPHRCGEPPGIPNSICGADSCHFLLLGLGLPER